MPERHLEDELPAWLGTLANDITPRPEAQAAVLRRIQAEGTPRHRRRPSFALPFASLAALVVVALLGGLLLYQGQRAPDQAGCSSGTVTALTCPVTDHGITLQVLSAQADAYSTDVHLTVSGAKDAVYDPVLVGMRLTDAHGRSYINTSDTYNGGNPLQAMGLISFAPLLPADLTQPQTFTFTVTRTAPTNGVPNHVGDKPPIDGNWQSRFTITPTVSKQRYVVQMAPVVQQGIGLTVQSLEVVPRPGNVTNVRLMLTFTGIPANTSSVSFANWSTDKNTICTASAETCKNIISAAYAKLTIPGLTIPSFSNINVMPIYPPQVDPDTIQSLNGMVQVELLYHGSGTVRAGTASLHLVHFRLFEQASPSPTLKTTLPPWDIPFTLK